MRFTASDKALSIIQTYPPKVRSGLELLRELIIESARETAEVDYLDESVKWGEPSYLTRHGSTIRIDWKKPDPEHIAMYFHCQTRLIDTFKEIYPDHFQFEGNRAILFKVGEKIPTRELLHCISLSLTYHKRKHLWLLGV